MKSIYSVLVLFLGLLPFSLHAETAMKVINRDAHFSYTASQPVGIQADGFSLTADSGSLIHDLDIRMAFIPNKGGTPLPSNMENVTGICEGVSLLPNGVHFSESNPASITLSYNPARIPMGYKPNEIYTYYCDDAQHWYRLERVAVDTIAHTVTSLTTHFTDFANAVIKVPEMPESKAFVPTAMTDLPDADPMKGIPMVEAPTPNNMGTAELTYPIELPKGRHGMQPNVDLHYSSAGGNGILGVGWSLSTPAITLDTRWGVPRYDPHYETEQYLVNGAAVLLRESNGKAKDLPYQNNSFLPRRIGDEGYVQFYARNTKNQDRIMRYGNSPTDYWWAVTDRNGVTTFYGRKFDPQNPSNDGIDESSVVRTDKRCIAYWAATASVDVYGNYILYNNTKEDNTIYVSSIEYTGNCKQNVIPYYNIELNYNKREDVSTNGRLGVLQKERKLLCNIVVRCRYPDYPEDDNLMDNLAAYYMQYNRPSDTSVFKSRLEKIIMLDSVHYVLPEELNNCDLSQLMEGKVEINQDLLYMKMREAEINHDRELFNLLQKMRSQPYGEHSIPASTTTFTYAPAPAADTLFQMPKELSNSGGHDLSESKSTSWSLGGTIAVGAGANVAMSTLSGGANYEYSRSKGGCKTMLLDLNGDGLTDIVYEDNGVVFYKRQYKNGNKYAFANEVPLIGITRLSSEVTSTHTWGLQLSLGANLSFNQPIATTYIDTYFSDVNADGLPDLIDGDWIRINHLVNGVPTFIPTVGYDTQTITVNNNVCNKGIIFDGEVDERIECVVKEKLVESYSLEEFFGRPKHYEWGRELVIDNEEKDKDPNSGPKYTNLQEQKEGVTYRIEGERVNGYLLEDSCTLTKLDPEVEVVRVWVAPDSGWITLTDNIALLNDTSITRKRSTTADGVSYTIQHCSSVSEQGDGKHLRATRSTLLHYGTIDANDTVAKSWGGNVYVQAGDILMFRLRSGENNLFDKTRWHHIVQQGSQIYDSERDFVCSGEGHFQAYKDGDVVLSFTGSNDGSVPVNLKIRKLGENPYSLDTLLSQGNVNIVLSPLQVNANDSIFISLDTIGNEPHWGDIHVIPELQYISDFPINDAGTQTVHDTITYYPDVQISYSSVDTVPDSPYRKLFGPLHRGWGEFAYQDLNHSDLIALDLLENTQLLAAEYTHDHEDNLSTYQPNITMNGSVEESDLLAQANDAFAATGTYDPVSKSSYWVPMRADSRTEQWLAYGNLGCIGRQVHSNAREITMQVDGEMEEIVEYDSSLPYRQGELRHNKFVRKQSRSVQNSISWGAPILLNESASFGSYESVVDYMDMNGDGYPDFVGKGGIQYSKPWGGIGELLPIDQFVPFKSSNTSVGMSFSASTADVRKVAGNNIRDGKYTMDAALR